YAGVPLARFLATSPDGGVANSYLYALPAGTQPASGTNNIVVTLDGVLQVNGLNQLPDLQSGAISASGVNQSQVFTSLNSKTGTSTSANVTLAANGASDLVIESAVTKGTLGTAAQTQRWKNTLSDTQTANSCGGATAAGGTTSLSWPVSPSNIWVMIGASF